MFRDEQPFSVSYPLSFLLRAAALSALSCALGLWILWWVFSQELSAEYAAAYYTIKNLLGFLFPAVAFCTLVVPLVACVGVFLVAMFASHKVAGPLFRLQRVADHLGRRVLIGTIHLRAGDQVRRAADAINEWVNGRKTGWASLRESAQACEAALRECEAAVARGDVSRLPGLIEVLRQRTGELPLK